MGASGVGIFDDDVACDARALLYEYLRAGRSADEATDAVLQDLADTLDDVEDGPVVILALAAAQWKAGRLDPRIKKRALELISQGVDFRWQGSEYEEQRRAVLAELATKLNAPPPPPQPPADLE